MVCCPHCHGRFEIPNASTCVANRELPPDLAIIPPEDYFPDPEKDYLTSEHSRRKSVTYYWQHRKELLEKAKAKRAARRQA
jgi:hypothetical protein